MSEPPTRTRAPSAGNPLHLLGLWGFAVVQPLLDVLSDEPTFFVIRGSRPVDLFVLLILLILAAPLPVVALSLASRAFGPRLHRWVHGTLIVLLLGAVFLVPAHLRLGLRATPSIALALALAGLGVWLYWRFAGVRQYATLLAAVLPLFAAAFLFDAGIRKLAFPRPVAIEPVASGGIRTPVVLVVLDELPLLSILDAESRIDSIRYPNLAALAGQGTWYPRATTVADFTQYAIPPLLTGVHPDRRKVAILRDYPRNLFTLLAGSHELQAMESLTQLCPPERCAGDSQHLGERMRRLLSDVRYVYLHLLLPAPLNAGLPSLAHTWQDFGRRVAPRRTGRGREIWRERRALFAADRSARFLDFVRKLRAGRRPPLIYLHTLLPHAPWIYLPSGAAHPTDGDPDWGEGSAWVDDEAAVREWQRRHLLQVGYVDTLLGRLWQRLRELGLYERSVIVVTADHGIFFEPGRHRRRLTPGNARDVLGVPLIIKAPFQTEAAIDMRTFESIDLLPTLATHLGLELPWEVDGRDVLDPETPALRPVTAWPGKARRGESLTFDPRFDYSAALARKVRLFGSGAEPIAPSYQATP